jgi:uncharacterized protein YndB with AHSA1/START domain
MTARKRATAKATKKRSTPRKRAGVSARKKTRAKPRGRIGKAKATLRRVGARAKDIGEHAILAATGKPWRHWFAMLDRAGAKTKDHRSIVAILSKVRGLSGWWQQMITVAYERARGLRKKHETARGYTANISKTLQVPLASLYAAWSEPERQQGWLGSPAPQVRSARPEQSLRLTWHDGSKVLVFFADKGENKSTVTVSHEKLPNARSVLQYKIFWKDALSRLEAVLEPITV